MEETTAKPPRAGLDAWATRKVVRVAVFGNGLSLTEWEQLRTSIWRHDGGIVVELVDHPMDADVLAVHGPLNPAVAPFWSRWWAQRTPTSKLLWVGEHGDDVTPDVVLAGAPPHPGVLKNAVARLMGWPHV